MSIYLLVLNYNGRHLLAECLPSIVRAAAASRHPCQVVVIDNDSTDDSLDWLVDHYPEVQVLCRPNEGLCSYNDVLADLPCRVAILLNNDIKLAEDAIDPLVAPLLEPAAAGEPECFMTAPLCWLFDGTTYEGFRTAVTWRWGLVQATALYPGHEQTMQVAGATASAGAVLAVDRRKFLELGGFDPLYLPGRLEDLDFCFRGYQTGYEARYVPESVAYHRGHSTFGAVYGSSGSSVLATRNTLLFQWKNLRHPLHVARQVAALPVRLAYDVARAPFTPCPARLMFTRALFGALGRVQTLLRSRRASLSSERERDFFLRFNPAHMATAQTHESATRRRVDRGVQSEEQRRAANYPCSRWYLRPLAGWLARRLASTRVRPWHLTLCGLAASAIAAALIIHNPSSTPWAAMLVLLAWFFDRADGQLARRQGTTSTRGAWLDANIDELADLGLHVATATAAAATIGWQIPGACLVAFLVGKYLLMYGVAVDDSPESFSPREKVAAQPTDEGAAAHGFPVDQPPWSVVEHAPSPGLRPLSPSGRGTPGPHFKLSTPRERLRTVYHLPGNADIRVHLLALGLLTGWLTAELALVAAYYNARWILRYVFVARRPTPPVPRPAPSFEEVAP